MSRPLAALRRSLDAMPSPEKAGASSGSWAWTWLTSANIDPASVVSFAALAFGRGEPALSGEGGA